ncbi:hypothetical protein U0035_05115 [Niabella yanshanensis]|uniref:Uncharacterized protein n=1 Tax=Niabella yanshanensis TaxID=577386 RepID=A0ABZ0WBJ7_9BACT|nr:hypothetical protein [Niabella yanshanensis]WQD39525.1 hypothetical protein U0035_05115 [Niabella yanshanensis]
MTPTGIFVKLFVKPVRRIITFELKNLFREETDTIVTPHPEKDIFKPPPKK